MTTTLCQLLYITFPMLMFWIYCWIGNYDWQNTIIDFALPTKHSRQSVSQTSTVLLGDSVSH
jgi:hypothetical protein